MPGKCLIIQPASQLMNAYNIIFLLQNYTTSYTNPTKMCKASPPQSMYLTSRIGLLLVQMKFIMIQSHMFFCLRIIMEKLKCFTISGLTIHGNHLIVMFVRFLQYINDSIICNQSLWLIILSPCYVAIITMAKRLDYHLVNSCLLSWELCANQKYAFDAYSGLNTKTSVSWYVLQLLPEGSPLPVKPNSEKIDLPHLKVDVIKYGVAGVFNETATQ